MEAKYYIIDYGKATLDIAETVIEKLRNEEHHVLVVLTKLDNYFAAEEITQDEFLDYFEMSKHLGNEN